MSSSNEISEYNRRVLQLREKELEIRERELVIQEQKHFADNQIGKKPLLTPAGSLERRGTTGRSDRQIGRVPQEPLHILLLRMLRNGSYPFAFIMLTATIGGIFTAQPSAALIALGFTVAFALTFVGAMSQLVLWKEGGDA